MEGGGGYSFSRRTFQFLPLLHPAAASNSGGDKTSFPGAIMVRCWQHSPSWRRPVNCLQITLTSCGTCGWRPMMRQDALLGAATPLPSCSAVHCRSTHMVDSIAYYMLTIITHNMWCTLLPIIGYTLLPITCGAHHRSSPQVGDNICHTQCSCQCCYCYKHSLFFMFIVGAA